MTEEREQNFVTQWLKEILETPQKVPQADLLRHKQRGGKREKVK